MLKTKVLMGIILVVGLAAFPAAAQKPDDSKLGPVTARPDRTTADPATRKQMQEKREALRKKRNECIKLRREQKIPLRKRTSFINECMAK